jgi:uncharacterized protein YcsI (UPF0317 family)
MQKQGSSKARDVLFSWIIGTGVVLVLAVLREQTVAPRVIRVLLRPGILLAHTTGHSGHDIGILLIVLADSIVYGTISFLILCALRGKRA